MWQMVLRGLLAGLVVVLVAEVARAWPRVGAVILFVPLVPPLVLLAMYLGDGDLVAVTRLSRQSLMLIPLGLTFFIPMAAAPLLKLGFWAAFSMGIVTMASAVIAYLYFSA